MADILDDEILELEGLFASDNSSMRNRHIEFARRDYVKLRQLGYVRAPSELKLNEYFWVDVLSYLQPRTQVEKIEENLEIRILQHPNGLWTYGVFVSYGTRGWSFLPGLFTGLFRSENEALTPGLAMYMKNVFAKNQVDVAVLGCYLNLANPNPEQLAKITHRYMAHIRFASWLGCGVVGTETGAPNETYTAVPE